ncbi:glycoside hydrolase family 127 protein [Vagococcus sp. BWB3-3]|uniref:Glycoside hydrolase family 127 protein n=1 Tax=Vagococcus allomyrinae TaxID=2794353 RepID=A0A940SSY3_9ENTE|nr:beta-L-arabinofuranosidase domain-containing protein [Vagococcus allomyrinae]MBP1042507.1 glycoside hydrolase family 127 protein [Vagococcus allomyrinae]
MEKMTLSSVEVTSEFWQGYRDLIVQSVLPYQWSVMNDQAEIVIEGEPGGKPITSKNSHVVANLRIAQGLEEGRFSGYPFQDSDAYKWLEAAAYSFAYHPDDNLRKITDRLIDLIAGVQEDDGYLVTYFQIECPERKFKRLQQSHEHYTMGHYIEAGIAYYQATGNSKALTIATRMADCIDENFGLEAGKIDGADGHPEIEIALAKLYELTNEQKYLDLVRYFINRRGADPDFYAKQNLADGLQNDIIAGMGDFPPSYYQADGLPVNQEVLEGHAVRVVYLCAGMAHVARLTEDRELLSACDRFWTTIVTKRMYITGGVGSTNLGEAFTTDYDLPNDTVYAETCASVGMVFFAKQMLGNRVDSRYGDVIEKELFNGALSGMSLDGKHFFYVNPLEVDPEITKKNPSRKHALSRRAEWFGCACCPSNLARLITSVESYIYEVTKDTILIDQFIANKAEFSNGVAIEQVNHFPWGQAIQVTVVNPLEKPVKLGIRIPDWTNKGYKLTVNGKDVVGSVENGYLMLLLGEKETQLVIEFDLSVKLIQANHSVRYDIGKVAVQRGPLVYCTEQVDNPDSLWKYRLLLEGEQKSVHRPDLLGGVTVIEAEAALLVDHSEALYTEYQAPMTEKVTLNLIPYYAWANRAEGQMSVWQHVAIKG